MPPTILYSIRWRACVSSALRCVCMLMCVCVYVCVSSAQRCVCMLMCVCTSSAQRCVCMLMCVCVYALDVLYFCLQEWKNSGNGGTTSLPLTICSYVCVCACVCMRLRYGFFACMIEGLRQWRHNVAATHGVLMCVCMCVCMRLVYCMSFAFACVQEFRCGRHNFATTCEMLRWLFCCILCVCVCVFARRRGRTQAWTALSLLPLAKC